MSKEFYLVTNATDIPATFNNTANANDTIPVAASSMTHTRGKDGDYCIIPTCTSVSNFAGNHMEVVGASALGTILNIAFWADDDKDPMLYYSLDGKYSNEFPVPDSKTWRGISVLIDLDSSLPVKFFPF